MKKIAFVLNSMNMGGTEKALLSMLNAMDLLENKVTIYLLAKKGELLSEIPNNVIVKEIKGYEKIKYYIHENIYKVIQKEILKGHVKNAICLGIAYCRAKLANDYCIYYKYFSKDIKNINEKFDLVVAYQGPMNYITYLVNKKFVARKKAAWIHFDISNMGYSRIGAEKVYQGIDKIFVVSEYSRQKFIEEFPELLERTETFLNILPRKKIVKMGSDKVEEIFEQEFINILTIGRISNQKGQDIIPRIVFLLNKKGYKIRWYLIGGVEKCDGKDPYKILENEIDKYHVKTNIIWLGIKENPYPYIKMCDIYVQPSRYEGYCTTTNEAKLFSVPIITTNVSGASEQFKNGENGIITEFDSEKIALEIEKIILKESVSKRLKKNLEKENLEKKESSVIPLLNLLEEL